MKKSSFINTDKIAVEAQKDTAKISELWNNIYKLIFMLAKRFHNYYFDRCKSCGVEKDDLIQSGYIAMLEALKYYTPGKGYKFTTYLNRCAQSVFYSMIGYGTKKQYSDPLNHYQSISTPLANETDSTLADIIPDTGASEEMETVEKNIYNQQLKKDLDSARKTLTDKQNKIIELIYYKGTATAKIAERYDKNRWKIQQLERQALEKLRRNKKLKEYREFILNNLSFKGVGILSFKNNGFTSSVERTVMKLEKTEKKENNKK